MSSPPLRLAAITVSLSLVTPSLARAEDRDPTVAQPDAPPTGEGAPIPATDTPAAEPVTTIDVSAPPAPGCQPASRAEPEPEPEAQPEPEPEPEPGEDELGPRMVRVGVGVTVLGASMAATSAGLWIGSAAVNRKVQDRHHDGVLDGTEDHATPTEDPDELERREALRVRGYRLNRATASTGIPAAVFLTAGVLMLAFPPEKKGSRRIAVRPSASPVGGGAVLVAGF